MEINRRKAMQALGVLGATTLMMDGNVIAEEKLSVMPESYDIDKFFAVIPLDPKIYANEHLCPFPLDLINQDNIAYCNYLTGGPWRHSGGDYVGVPGYTTTLHGRYKDADGGVRIESRYNQMVEREQMQVLAASAYDRGIICDDSYCNRGMSLRLIAVMKLVMRRNGGGKPTSRYRGRLTDLILPKEIYETWKLDIKNMTEVERRQIFIDREGHISRAFGVNLHSCRILNKGGDIDQFLKDDLVIPYCEKDRTVIGLDLTRKDAFVMPVWYKYTEPPTYFEGKTRLNLYAKYGIACLDNKRVLLGQI